MTSLKWASLDLLEKACEDWFMQNFSTRPFIPSVHDASIFPFSEELDVVLVGRLHEEILLFNQWPGKRFRLWAMCSTAKKARVIIDGIDESHIGFLPRYDLFPVQLAPREFPSKGTTWSIVYSGRITMDKGFGTYLKVSSELQDAGEDVTPIIFGILQKGRTDKDKAEIKELKNLIGTLNWRIRPEIHLGVSSTSWINHGMTRPVLFNFTTFINDDFGVSAAQAQQAGWPLLISNWGGHRDVVGSNVRKFAVIDGKFPETSRILELMRSQLPEVSALQGHSIGKYLHRDQMEIYAQNLSLLGIKPYKEWPLEVQEKTKLIFNGEI